MCGIVGVAGRNLPGRDAIDAMCRMIVHRGPDDQGIYLGSTGQIGMRRLSIIDLAGGHQPIHNEDESVWLVFNGEIYNFRELREDLERRGHAFYTNTDTECIVHCYEEYGDACFSRLRGMFAIAIVDVARNRVVLARDRIGKKPLYYQVRDGQLSFASELKSLLVLPGFDRTVSRTAVHEYLVLGYVPAPGTIFEGVRKLEPAHYLVFENGAVSTHRYWRLDFEPKWEADEQTLRGELLRRLEDAVRVRLVSDVPFGVFLSGGIDSSIVAALMARNMGPRVKTFTIGFKELDYDETADARRVAEHIGAEHHELVVTADTVSLIDELVWHLDEPFADASAIPTYLVAKLAAEHVKMVLSGDGGDESFAGYERYRKYQALSLATRVPFAVPGRVLQSLATLLPGGRGNRIRRIGNRLMMGYPDRYLSGVALGTQEDVAALLRAPGPATGPYGSVRKHFLSDDIVSEMDRILAGDMATYLVDDVLVKVDRMTMAKSIESRAPLLDHHLMEFAARLPVSLKLRNGTAKYLLKEVARMILPPESVEKKKQGFGIPLAKWFRHDLRERMFDLLASRSFRERGLFDAQAALQSMERHVAGEHDYSEQLWQLMCYESWAQQYVDARPPGHILPPTSGAN
jgi:asparagine synthase (glutamine-hydrolysing)